MTTLVAVFLPFETTREIVRATWVEAGFEEMRDFSRFSRSGGEPRVSVGLDPYEKGCVVRLDGRLDDLLLAALATRTLAAGGSLLVIESAVEASWICEWDADGPRRQEVRNPDWSAKERSREQPGARIAAWQLEEIAAPRLGARQRGAVSLSMRARPVAPVELVRRALDEGATVVEVVHQGRAGFRFPSGGGSRTVFLGADETEEIRARLRG